MAPLTVQVSASYGAGITCRQSMTKSKLWNRTGKNHVGYQGMAKVINIALMFENDIILQRLPLLIPKLLNGKLEDYDLKTCQVNWTIKIPANTLAIQLNKLDVGPVGDEATANEAVNFNAVADPLDTIAGNLTMTAAQQGYAQTEILRFWLGFSTACGPF
ncbi:MAG: hypothetical protein EZS28_032844, partial [Streblomastix strix]